MKYLADVQKLCEILAAELEGHRIDHGEAHGLVQRLTEQCPDIASTLSSIGHRMAQHSTRQSAA